MPRRQPNAETQVADTNVPPPGRSVLSRRKRRIYVALALLIPVVFLGILEAGLRFAKYGGYPPTILRVGPMSGGTLCITDNPGPASYFFANKSRPGTLDTYSFLAPKPKGTIRVVIGGESAAKGFPQPMCFAPSAFLEAMLHDLWLDRKVEVINLGTTAVASFPVLGMLTEALDYEPDLVIVHCGNNEFFGAYGVASLHRAGNTPTAMALHRTLRSLALVQFIDSFARPAEPAGHQRTLMETMVGQSFTAPDDPLRGAAAYNLKTHVGKIIERCKARGVPVIVCTMAANERDLAPLGDSDASVLSPEDQAKLHAALEAAEKLMDRESGSAIVQLKSATALLPTHARAQYLLGRAQYAQKDYSSAIASFQKAIDLDPMPWRCPGPSNQAIREAAAQSGAVLCDLQKAFRDASEGGCVGWELMDDHVHPSLLGQALTARAIVSAMTALTGEMTVRPEALANLPGDGEYLRRLGDNPYDRYGVAHTVRVLCDVPFIRRTNPQAYERFDAICRDIERDVPPEVVTVARKWQDPMTHPGAKRPITGMVGRVMIRMGNYDEAERLYEVARRSVAHYSSWNLEYNYFRLVCRERLHKKLSDEDRALALECIERGNFLLSHGRSESGMAERYCGRLHQLRGEWNEAIPFLLAARPKVSGSDLVAVDQALVVSYMSVGRRVDALRLIDDGIDNSGEFASLYRQMRKGLASVPSGDASTQPTSDESAGRPM
ncbi:MAG TPA: tetratricopeptide repeat protein [Phycisphaerae bacterium]|nr:tetratricopeptide repeat protein [Phycisphaerae bacterium]